jgi:hypothetical protein
MSKITNVRLPNASATYDPSQFNQLVRSLEQIIFQLNNTYSPVVTEDKDSAYAWHGDGGGLMDTTGITLPVSINGTNTDAFGRLRVSTPYSLFDSQNRYATDNQFDTSTSGTGTATVVTNQSSVAMTVTSGGVGSVVRQTYRNMLYQPGKSLLVLATFLMSNSTSANLNQRVGYFNTQNGVFFQRTGGVNSFVLRSYTSGVADDSRIVNQADWNVDPLNGSGPSGITLDLTHPQILWMDFEWLGVGTVRCGFIIDGVYVVCHAFDNANVYGTTVYMTTAILPVRYEITSTTTAVAATLSQICSSVISEGGFEAISVEHVARRTTIFNTINTAANFFPIVSIRLASTALGAVVIPKSIQFQPTTLQNYEIALIKNPTLTGATWAAAVPSDSNVEYDVAATAISAAGTIVQNGYIASSGGGGQTSTIEPTGYNWDLQLGVSLTSVSDIYTLGVRTISGATTGDGLGSISFFDLTQ